MDITIVAGKCGDLNFDYILNQLRQRDKSKNHIIIAPDRCLFSIEQRLFEDLQESCFFDINVISFSRLSHTLLSKTPNKKILSKQSGVALVKMLLNESKDELVTFKKATNYMGFANSLFETICLYKSCNISPDDMFVTDSSDYANLKQRDIQLIYKKYEDYLKNDYTDSFNQLRLFANMIDKDFCKDTCFYFVEFDDFTSIMYDIIAKLSKFSDKSFIACTYSKESNNSNVYLNKVYYDLIDLMKSNGLNYTIKKPDSFGDEKKDIMLSNLLSFAPITINDANNSIRLLSFDDKSDEIKYTLRTIYKTILENPSLTFSDFAIVLPSLSYIDDIKNELDLYDIPYYIDQSELIVNHILIRTIFDICKILIGNFDRSDFTNLIKNNVLNFDKFQVLDYDSYLKSHDKKGFQCLNSEKITDDRLLQFIDFLKNLINTKKTLKSNNDYMANIIRPIIDYIYSCTSDYKEKLDVLESRVFSQVENKLDSIINDFSDVFGTVNCNFDDFVETFKSYFETTNISLPPITSNTLFIADFNASYVNKCAYVYILGCEQGKLPKYSLDNGLVSDEEIARLPNSRRLSPTIAMINARRNFKLFELMFKATKLTTLSYSTNGADGKSYPNNLIQSITNIFANEIEYASPLLDIVNTQYHGLNEDITKFNNLTQKVILKNILDLLKEWDTYSENLNYRQLLSTLVSVSDKKDLNRLIENNNLMNLVQYIDNANLFKNNSTSVSQLECYFSCPYKHFARYGLSIEKNKEYKLEPRDIGNIIHNVLKSLMIVILDNIDDLDFIKSQAKKLLEKLLNDDYKEIVENPRNAYILKSLYEELDRVCKGLVEELKSSSYRPKKTSLEYRFNPNSLIINGINIKGTIDRIDFRDDGFIVIDYKTGDNSFDNYNDVYSGKKLQILVYARAFEIESKKKCNGMFYLPLSNEIRKDASGLYRMSGAMIGDTDNIIALDNNLINSSYKSNVINIATLKSGEFAKNNCYNYLCMSREDMDYLLSFAINKAKEAIDEIKNGDIAPKPLKDGQMIACKYCDFKGLCNYLGDNDNVVQSKPNIKSLKEKGDEDGISAE